VSTRPRERINSKGAQVRLGIYTPNYPGISGEGGIGTYVRELAAELAAQGHEVHVLTPGSRPVVLDRNVHVHSVQADYLRLIDRVYPGAGACYHVGRAMNRLVSRFGLNVVEFPNWEGLGIYYAWRRPTPMVVRLHTSSLETIEIDRLPMNRLLSMDVRREHLQAKLADVLVTHSLAHRQMMAQELAIDPGRIGVVPHGLRPADPPVGERDAKTIVFLGRLERRKGSIDLLRAAAAVIEEHPDARFVFIGADRPHCPGERTHAQYLADEFPPEVRAHIQFLGRLPDAEVQLWLQRATLFVAPSLYESFGLVFLEAMRYGTPVIGTRVGGIPEVVEDGKSGVLVTPESPDELAVVIIDLLRNPVRRAELGERGRNRSQTLFSASRVETQMVALYREAIQKWRR
jgi:glycosyltransferase involved in cell wall biosynthesis